MRIVWFTPIAYMAGIEGFGFLLPYMAFVATVLLVVRAMKSRARSIRRVDPANALGSTDLLELETAAA